MGQDKSEADGKGVPFDEEIFIVDLCYIISGYWGGAGESDKYIRLIENQILENILLIHKGNKILKPKNFKRWDSCKLISHDTFED